MEPGDRHPDRMGGNDRWCRQGFRPFADRRENPGETDARLIPAGGGRRLIAPRLGQTGEFDRGSGMGREASLGLDGQGFGFSVTAGIPQGDDAGDECVGVAGEAPPNLRPSLDGGGPVAFGLRHRREGHQQSGVVGEQAERLI